MLNVELEETEAPSAMKSLWTWWKQVAKRIGEIQARLFLNLFYFLVLGPFALVVRWGERPASDQGGYRSRLASQGR